MMQSFGQNLGRRRAAATAKVNEGIGAVRRRYITTIPGQDMVYQAKEAEAKDYLAMTPPPATLQDFPLLAAEIGLTAPSAQQLAQLWLNMSAQWRAIAAQLETLRLGTIQQIEAAPTLAQIETLVANFNAVIEAL